MSGDRLNIQKKDFITSKRKATKTYLAGYRGINFGTPAKIAYDSDSLKIEYTNTTVVKKGLAKVIVYEDIIDFIFTNETFSIKIKNWDGLKEMIAFFKQAKNITLETKIDKKPNDDWFAIMQLFDF